MISLTWILNIKDTSMRGHAAQIFLKLEHC